MGVRLDRRDRGASRRGARRSPVGMPDGLDVFAHTQARDWLSLTSEPEHARSTALVVGVATRGVESRAGALRPTALGHAGRPSLKGTFTRRSFPYRPLPRGSFELAPTVQLLFEPGRVETVLHLLGDSRPIVGAGESTFTRGAFWVVPLADHRGMASP